MASTSTTVALSKSESKSKSTSRFVDIPSSAIWTTRQVSNPNEKVPLILDEEFFRLPDLHKFKDLINKYVPLIQKSEFIDTLELNRYIHRRCPCCTRYICKTCNAFILHHRDDFLMPYCHICEMFLDNSKSN